VVVKAADPTGVSYDLPLAVGDRVRLFARTNAAYADKSRGIIGNNGSVLEVRGIDAAGVILRNAQGREGLVKWETLRDTESKRIRLSYGDVLSIDATQGLTSTEHIEAMPAGTQAVNAYKAYTQASRHRETSWLVTSDGAERREIAGRRPLGDPRPIREADVWANMARNLARAPEKASALDFLEQARDLRRGAVQGLQAGLRLGEQRQAEGLERFTLRETLQRRRQVDHVAQMNNQIHATIRAQGRLQKRLSQATLAIRKTVWETVEAAAPLLRQAAVVLRERHVLSAVRSHLLDLRMADWRREQTQNPSPETEQAAQKRFREGIGAMPIADLQRAVAERRQEHEARQKRAPRRRSDPSTSR
jgi:hypothetical protein